MIRKEHKGLILTLQCSSQQQVRCVLHGILAVYPSIDKEGVKLKKFDFFENIYRFDCGQRVILAVVNMHIIVLALRVPSSNQEDIRGVVTGYHSCRMSPSSLGYEGSFVILVHVDLPIQGLCSLRLYLEIVFFFFCKAKILTKVKASDRDHRSVDT